jgi:hypothetical protein
VILCVTYLECLCVDNTSVFEYVLRCTWSGMWWCVVGQLVPNLLEDCGPFETSQNAHPVTASHPINMYLQQYCCENRKVCMDICVMSICKCSCHFKTSLSCVWRMSSNHHIYRTVGIRGSFIQDIFILVNMVKPISGWLGDRPWLIQSGSTIWCQHWRSRGSRTPG